ncbi:MAG: carbohydrate ABC transporter permease [Candidatus Methanomethylicia archaeon]
MKITLTNTFFILSLVILTIGYILPIYVMFVTSLKTPLEITQRTYLIPGEPLQFQNYIRAFELTFPSLINSSIITISVTAISTFIGGLNGYFLSRYKSKLTKVLFILIVIGLFIPYQVILIPLVQIMAATKLALTYLGLILSYIILNVPLASTLMGTFFFSIPRELEESAEVDGASRIGIFFKIISPIAAPAYASTSIIIFTQVWNEFLLALTLSTPYTTPITVKLAEIKGSYVALYNLQMAAALLSTMVPLLLFLFLGKYFVRGILAGALKG